MQQDQAGTPLHGGGEGAEVAVPEHQVPVAAVAVE
jgi:hypothetical protein